MSEKKFHPEALALQVSSADFSMLCDLIDGEKAHDTDAIGRMCANGDSELSIEHHVRMEVKRMIEQVLSDVLQPWQESPIAQRLEEIRGNLLKIFDTAVLRTTIDDVHILSVANGNGAKKSGKIAATFYADSGSDFADQRSVFEKLVLLNEMTLHAHKLMKVLQKQLDAIRTKIGTSQIFFDRAKKERDFANVKDDERGADAAQQKMDEIESKTLPRFRVQAKRKEKLLQLLKKWCEMKNLEQMEEGDEESEAKRILSNDVAGGHRLLDSLSRQIAEYEKLLSLEPIQELMREEQMVPPVKNLNEVISSVISVRVLIEHTLESTLGRSRSGVRERHAASRLRRYAPGAAVLTLIAGGAGLLSMRSDVPTQAEMQSRVAKAQLPEETPRIRFRTSDARKYRGARNFEDLPREAQIVFDQLLEGKKKNPFTIHAQEQQTGADGGPVVAFGLEPFETLPHVVAIDFKFCLPEGSDMGYLESLAYYKPGDIPSRVMYPLSRVQKVVSSGGALCAAVETDFHGEEDKSVSFFVENVVLKMNDDLAAKIGYGKVKHIELKR